MVYQEGMLGDILFLYWFYSLAQEVGFHFVLEEVSRCHISTGVWDIIPDLSNDIRKTFFQEF